MAVVKEASALEPPTSALNVVVADPFARVSEKLPFTVDAKVIALLACVDPVPPVIVDNVAFAINSTA